MTDIPIRHLNLEGARSALPIWTEFMKRAAQLRPYRDAKPFGPPHGIVSARICEKSGELASPLCPNARTEMFISDTEPVAQCERHSPGPQQISDRVVDLAPAGAQPNLYAPTNVAPGVPQHRLLPPGGVR